MSGCLACIYDSGLLIIIILCTMLTYIEGFNQHNNIINILLIFFQNF
jgi:hypothetical protein